MGRSIAQRIGAIVGLGLLLAACSSSKKTNDANGGGVTCEAGARRCEGFNVKVCSADGTEETIEDTCLPSETCIEGVCLGAGTGGSSSVGGSGNAGSAGAEKTCVPNTTFCKDGSVRQCDGKGEASTLVQRCDPDLYCRSDEKSASCSTEACTPDSALCDGSVATICLSDGSGPKKGGVDCESSNQACYKGKCRDIACTPGSKVCQHDDVYLCGENGTDLALWADCQSNEVCDAEQGTCRAKLCEPGKVSCDGNRAVTCNDFGSAWRANSTDCLADGKVCVTGSCRAPLCAAYTSFCQDGSVYQCDGTGTISTLSQTCTPSYSHCETYNGGSYGYCRANDCTPGQKVCADNMIKTCSADGSLPPDGVACGANQYCENATCKDSTCTAGTFLCQDGDVYYCPYGGAPQLSQTCLDDTPCKSFGDLGVVCSPRACSPGDAACIGNQIGTCGADGQSLSAATENCNTTTSVCSAALKCEKSVTDTVGVAENHEVAYAGTLLADAFEVSSARKLTQIQMQLALDGARQLRWVIFELSGSTYVAKLDQVVSGVTGTGFISSGALNYSLKAGKRYLLGVVVSGGDAIDYMDAAPYPQTVSFGTALGRVNSSYYSSIDVGYVDSSYLYQMKAVTEAP
ncbi:MAG TPA: hypothetical protein VEQ58_23665 [Polyangiaceae bacterium]|nr:hypothetical protein [Polyangiaceae bacterium]